MGDAGSQFLGFSLGVILLSVTQNDSIYSPVLPLFILGTPILDTLLVMYERISQGLSPFLPDKRHLHHKLLQFGFTHEQSVVVIYVFHFLLILVGWSMRFGPDYIVLFIYLCLLGAFLAIKVASDEKRKWVKDCIGVAAGALLRIKAKFRFNWSRDHVSKFCGRSFFILFAAYYLILPFYAFQVHPWIGWGSMLLAAGVAILVYLSSSFPSNTMRIILYFITLYLVIIKGSSPVNIHLFSHEIELSTLLFVLITIFYFMYLLFNSEKTPLNSINYLFIALAVFVALIPAYDERAHLFQHVISTSIFYGLYINLIFLRIQRNIPFVLILTGFSLIVVFVKFQAGCLGL
jgi:UDP-GlcNAc:undecaprenyl-phosphate GlcNAc-1-phosphate transferase